jgi:hypothetical protein
MSVPKGNGLGAKNDQPARELTTNTADFNGFAGTDNPRHLRVIQALLSSPRPREELDSIAGCSNAPELVAELRRRGLDTPCSRRRKVDRDRCDVLTGTYFFTQDDSRKVNDWKATTLPLGGKP